jgi:hypothetical protein
MSPKIQVDVCCVCEHVRTIKHSGDKFSLDLTEEMKYVEDPMCKCRICKEMFCSNSCGMDKKEDRNRVNQAPLNMSSFGYCELDEWKVCDNCIAKLLKKTKAFSTKKVDYDVAPMSLDTTYGKLTRKKK